MKKGNPIDLELCKILSLGNCELNVIVGGYKYSTTGDGEVTITKI